MRRRLRKATERAEVSERSGMVRGTACRQRMIEQARDRALMRGWKSV